MKEENDPDEWRRENLLVNGFKEACNKISTSYLKVGDDSMSAIHVCTTAKGDLPHLSYILLKDEPLGKELNNVGCYVTGSIIFLRIHRG